MRYADLLHFDPIETVVQLRESGQQAKARELVRSYVISNDMAERLRDVLFPNLLLEGNPNSRGVLVVGNYGSGKSHLMSVISALTEDKDALQDLENNIVRDAAKPLSGKFKVVRTEIGSTTMGLREILTGTLTRHLAELGVDFTFPAAHEVSENKTSFEDMLGKFH